VIPEKGLAPGANIPIRAALGKRVHALLRAYEDSVAFYIPQVLSSRGDDPETGAAVLDQIRLLVQPVDEALYRDFEQLARERMVARDVEDWPIVAVALMLKILAWTEDRDFFGSGIATWTTDRVELYLQGRHG
jgi:PIN domain